MPTLVPTNEDPWGVTLEPINHDPFAVQHAMDAINADTQARRDAASSLFRNTVGAPGVVTQPIAPQTASMWSDEDEARRLATEGTATNWGPAAALAMTGGSGAAPAERDAVGMGVRAYHGSPHDFDKFDLSKIGTGEGAQAYGHGLYFAENPKVAESYRNLLTPEPPPNVIDAVRDLDNLGFRSPSAALAAARENPDWMKHANIYPNKPGSKSSAAKLIQDWVSKPQGRAYEVSINADPEHFLDWDKPLSEQHPVVQQALQDLPSDPYKMSSKSIAKAFPPDTPMSEIITKAGPRGESHLRAFADAGVPGIKYLDQGSRPPMSLQHIKDSIEYHKGRLAADPDSQWDAEQLKDYQSNLDKYDKGSRNYVVFDDKTIDILKKYGMAGLIAGGAAHFRTSPVSHDPFAQ